MKSANSTHYILSVILLLSSAFSFAQSPDSLVASGDVAHMNYAFDYAVKAYSEALSIMEKDSTDTLGIRLLKDKLLLSENGRNMRKFAYSPSVVARHRFSIEDFYLYYPLPDKSWRPSSNLTGEGFAHPFHKATYAPEGAERIFYSAADHEGICNIYMTELEDSLWSVPAFLNEHMLSAADEIYPMLSPDGRTLYFASKGLYGV
ncbi:MAG: PD40 domain-containing protein, partial [Bacteroidales bacterium]|nr:PD40 domain-containing protein [Bacteroidales bacterium]